MELDLLASANQAPGHTLASAERGHERTLTQDAAPDSMQATSLDRVPFGSLPGDALRELASDLLQKAALRARHRLPVASALGLAQHLLARAERLDTGERS